MKKVKLLAVATLVGATVSLVGCAAPSAYDTEPTETTEEVAGNPESITIQVEPNEDGSVTIPTDQVTNEAVFYEFTYNGTEMGALAVQASDGTTRVALNTCEVCNNSGKGYYEQTTEGMLECQNCGNLYAPDDIGMTAGGGCNPVPVTDADKTVNEDGSVTISSAIIEANAALFTNWKQ